MTPDLISIVMTAAGLLSYLALGFVLGQLYFRGVWHSARLLTGRPGPAVGLALLRFGLLACLLFLAARQGALPLLAVAAGLLLARPLALRWAR